VRQLAGERPRVEAFRVALDEHAERAVHEDFAERHTGAQSGPGRRVGRDGRNDHDFDTEAQARSGGLSKASYVLDAVGLRETEIAAEITPNHVAVEQLDVVARLAQLGSERPRQGRLARAR
jgi:hypothetical protein